MNRLELINYALGKLGEPPIDSYDDTRSSAAAVRVCYQQTLDRLIRKYRWNFARKSATLEPAWTVVDTNPLLFIEDNAWKIDFITGPHPVADGDRILIRESGIPALDAYWVVEHEGGHVYVLLDSDEQEWTDTNPDTGVEFHIAPKHTYGYRIALPEDCAALRTVDGYEAKRLPHKYVIEGGHILCDNESIDIAYTRRMVMDEDEENFDDTFREAFAWLLASELAMPVVGSMARRNEMLEMFNQEITDALMSNVFERRDPDIDRKHGETSYAARTYA